MLLLCPNISILDNCVKDWGFLRAVLTIMSLKQYFKEDISSNEFKYGLIQVHRLRCPRYK